MQDQALLKYNWEPTEDAILTNICLEFIATGKTMLDAYKVASELMGETRTPGACEQRWNTALKKRVIKKVEKARNIRYAVRSAAKQGKVLRVDIDAMTTIEVIPIEAEGKPEQELGKSLDTIISEQVDTPTVVVGAANPEPAAEEAGEAWQEEPSERELYEHMLKSIDAVLTRGINRNERVAELEDQLSKEVERGNALFTENAMLWDRCSELEEIERKYKAIMQVMGGNV